MVVVNNKIFFLGIFLFFLLFINYFFINDISSSSTSSSSLVSNHIQKYTFSHGLRLPSKYMKITDVDKTFFKANVVKIPDLDNVSLLTDEISKERLPFRNSIKNQ